MARPKKAATPKADENPDHVPATREYVKCIARKMIDKGNFSYYFCKVGVTQGIVSLLGATVAFFAWIAAFGFRWEPYLAWMLGLTWIILGIVCIETQQTPEVKMRNNKLPEYLEKYKPPEDNCKL